MQLERIFVIESDTKKFRSNLLSSLFISFIYSIIYGIFEYFIVYTYGNLIDRIIPPQVNWAFMYLGIIFLLLWKTNKKWDFTLMGLFFMIIFEDIIYWTCYWIDTGIFPFPAVDWWDIYLASFRILGNLGQPISFPPYFPLYYIPGYFMIFLYYLLSLRGSYISRILSWILIPIFSAVIIGAFYNNDLYAIISVYGIILSSYSGIGILAIKRYIELKKGKINEFFLSEDSKNKTSDRLVKE
ncbi:hypothetical protein [Candidatus Harpocratesius sp.]